MVSENDSILIFFFSTAKQVVGRRPIILKHLYLILVNSLFWSFFVISSLVLVFGAVLLRITTPWFDPNLKLLQKYTCFWSSLYLWANPFWSLTKRGMNRADPHRTYIIVANHQSMADILCVFNTFLHFKWVAKKSLFKLPLLGWNMTFNGYVPIDRGNLESREKCMKECRAWLEKGSSILFFPEGTRSKNGRLQSFKAGAFHLALETGHDILPIVIRGSLHAIPKHSRLLSGNSKMSLEILPPVSIIPYQNLGREAGANELSQAVYATIAANLHDDRSAQRV
jgi:1-acyl-sn-glycerol-3-phosphate acyltransferase